MNRHLLLAILTVATPAFAASGFQDTTALDRAVAGFTGQPTGEIGGARTGVDMRLRLKACPMVTMAWRSDTHDAVVVSCTGPEWRIFVPVRAAPAAMAITVAGTAAPAAKAAIVIKRNDPIVVEAGGTGFAIQRDGIALGDAPAGGRFLVKVDGAKGPIQAVAIEAGHATLPGWSE